MTTDESLDHPDDRPDHGGPTSDDAAVEAEASAPPEHADADELVGPGRYPLRVQPAAAIQPGTADARRLLTIWFVRKSFYWIFFVGFAVAGVVAIVEGEETTDVDIDWLSPSSIADTAWSPWAGLILALVVRFVASWVALGLAFPLALAHEPNLSPRINFGSGIGKFFDRLHVARAFRSLRWTHHVRQVAQHRLGPAGERLGRLDPIFDIVNIASGVLAFVALILAAALAA